MLNAQPAQPGDTTGGFSPESATKEIDIGALSELDDVSRQHRLVLAYFGKDNCPGCVSLDQLLNKLKGEGALEGMVIAKTKVEKIGPEAFREMGLRSAPSLILFRDNDEVYRLSGFTGERPVREAISEHLV